MTPVPLSDHVVIDLSGGIAGAYCTKMLVDAGAEVIKVEPIGGDPLRRWTASSAVTGRSALAPGEDGALFQFLCAGKRSVVLDLTTDEGRAGLLELVAGADVIVEDLGPHEIDRLGLALPVLQETNAGVSLVSISDFGWNGPWASRPASEFTLQALSGSMSQRGMASRTPLAAGGRTGEWLAGSFAALAVLAIWRRRAAGGRGEHADVSMLESLVLTHTFYQPLAASMGQRQPAIERFVEFPSIETARDDLVGFCTVQARTWHDFCHLIDHPEWAEDPTLRSWVGRNRRLGELSSELDAWLSERSAEDVMEMASLMRIAVAPIGNGERTPTFDHFREREVFVENPGGFIQPRVPYQLSARSTPVVGKAPRLAEHQTSPPRRPVIERDESPGGTGAVQGALPLEGIRVADFTGAWAGSFGAQLLAMLGAEVIKVESISRPDTARFGSVRKPTEDDWWEAAPIFQGANTNKRSLTLDLNQEDGLALARRLIAVSDIVAENFSPRVMEHFGLDYPAVRAINPRAIMLRMPAFGLSGPWRDRIGYAQTMEQVSGMAWVTGYPDGLPLIPKGLCDPLTGLVGVIGVLVALADRDRTGDGQLVEASMVEAALNVAAEPLVEFSKYGELLGRMGNRGLTAAPQNVYACEGADSWVALAVHDEAQWLGLRRAMGDPAWADNDELSSPAGRRAGEDQIDKHIADWLATRAAADVVEVLSTHGVPSAEVTASWDVHLHAQLQARGFFESLTHPVIGTHDRFPGLPFHLSGGPDRWNRSCAPTLGRDSADVLRWLFGLSDEQIDGLTAADVTGTRPTGV